MIPPTPVFIDACFNISAWLVRLMVLSYVLGKVNFVDKIFFSHFVHVVALSSLDWLVLFSTKLVEGLIVSFKESSLWGL